MSYSLSGLESLSVRHLAVVSELTSTGSMSAAAERLNLSQPAISKALKYTEAQIGYALFDRSRQGVKPTEQGIALIKHANLIIRNLRNAADEMQGEAGRGELVLGLHTGPSAFIPANFFGSVHSSGVFRANAKYGTQLEMNELAQQGLVDVFFGDTSGLSPDFETVDLFEDQYVITVKKTKPNLEKLTTPTSFTAKNWVLPEKGSKLRRMFDYYASVENLQFSRQTFTTNNEAVRFTLCAICDYAMLWPKKMAEYLDSSDLWLTDHQIEGTEFVFSAAFRADNPRIDEIRAGVKRISEITTRPPFKG